MKTFMSAPKPEFASVLRFSVFRKEIRDCECEDKIKQ